MHTALHTQAVAQGSENLGLPQSRDDAVGAAANLGTKSSPKRSYQNPLPSRGRMGPGSVPLQTRTVSPCSDDKRRRTIDGFTEHTTTDIITDIIRLLSSQTRWANNTGKCQLPECGRCPAIYVLQLGPKQEVQGNSRTSSARTPPRPRHTSLNGPCRCGVGLCACMLRLLSGRCKKTDI